MKTTPNPSATKNSNGEEELLSRLLRSSSSLLSAAEVSGEVESVLVATWATRATSQAVSPKTSCTAGMVTMVWPEAYDACFESFRIRRLVVIEAE